MAVHDIHDALPGDDPDAILYDGCGECEERAATGLYGLCHLDSHNLPLLWNRMLNERMGGAGWPSAGYYRSNAERTLGESLYLMGVLDQRGMLHDAAFSPGRFDSNYVASLGD